MATVIDIDELTNGDIVNKEWQGTGVFDVLIDAVNKNIDTQYLNGRIKGAEYAKVYLGSIQSVISESIRYLLDSKKTEVNIDATLADIELKRAELESRKNTTEAELEKQWGYDVTRDAENNLVLGQSTGDGLIDGQIQKIDSDILIDEEDIKIKRAKADKDYAEMLASIDKEYGMYYELDSDGNIIRSSLISDGGGKIDAELLLIQKEEALKAQQILSETENTELIKEKTESEAMMNMADGMLQAQIEKMQADILIANEDILIKKAKSDKEYVEMLAKVDKEYGFSYQLDDDGNIIRDTLTDTADGKMDYESLMTQAQSELVGQQKLTEEKNTELVQEKVETENKHNEIDGLIDKQIEKIDADILLSQEEIDLKKTEADMKYAEMLSIVDKEYGMYYEKDAEGNIIRSSIIDDGGGKIDMEVDVLAADKALKEDALLTEQAKRDEIILARKRELLELRLKVFESLYSSKVIDNMPGIVDDSDPSTIDSLYAEVHTGDIS